jgi:gliding motility-associated-like protein
VRKLHFILLLLFSSLFAEATHQVSGYISFKWISGTTYSVTFTDYTNVCGTLADDPTVTIHWGDSTSSTLTRSNGLIDPNTGIPEGEPVCTCRKVGIYTGTHPYLGNGTYHISIDISDRMANIANMSGSVGQDLYLFSTVILEPFAGYNIVSPVITNPLACINACGGECFYYNLGAYSPEGDSIAYSLGNCLTLSGIAGGYYIPPGVSIDNAGTLTWCNPPKSAIDTIYNFAILLRSYKSIFFEGKKYRLLVDTVECELEVLVKGNCTNTPPSITGHDTCIVAGTYLTFTDTATDGDHEGISLVATGEPFTLSPPATQSVKGANPAILTFNWNTDCSDVRTNPYSILITATDDGYPTLNAYKSINITVVGPAPGHLVATPIGNAVQLHWNPSKCPQVTGYSIYRHYGCYKWIHAPCEIGVPFYTGYIFIGSTKGINDTTYLDNNGGKGLAPGIDYDYMVVANYPFPDADVSLASNDTCVLIKREVPVIVNVSVDNTDAANGNIFIRWTKPLADTANLDTIKNKGPYSYVLKRATGISGANFATVDSVSSKYFKSPTDTTFKDALLNTTNIGYNYRVDLYCDTNKFIGSSATASSIYLSIKPDNNVLHLSWNSDVPWNDSLYSIYRKPPLPYPQVFSFLATVPGTIHTYNDSNLTNGSSFCYYVKSTSQYPGTTILDPLYDSSEIMCAAPKDTIPPCGPKFNAFAQCSSYSDSLIWNNPDYTCSRIHNNLLLYEIFYTPVEGGDMQLIATINNLADTVFVRDSLTSSVAGCYAVVAVDSFGNQSAPNTLCIDNCPEYVLPNVFTPNGDGKNDFFTPILPYRFIKDIDIDIFNRWGELMFTTIDPNINWNGNDQSTGKPCPDGVYYYVCQVHEIHVTGIKTITLKGFVQILH